MAFGPPTSTRQGQGDSPLRGDLEGADGEDGEDRRGRVLPPAVGQLAHQVRSGGGGERDVWARLGTSGPGRPGLTLCLSENTSEITSGTGRRLWREGLRAGMAQGSEPGCGRQPSCGYSWLFSSGQSSFHPADETEIDQNLLNLHVYTYN